MSRFTLRIDYVGAAYTFDLVIDKEAVYTGGKWLPGLDIPEAEAQLLHVALGDYGLNVDVPLYCFHEGRDVRGTFSEDVEDNADPATATWEIQLDGKPATFEEIDAAIHEGAA